MHPSPFPSLPLPPVISPESLLIVPGVLGTQAYTNYFQVGDGNYKQGAITCAMPFGSLVGALASSFIADKFSRVYAIQMSTILWIIGSIFQTASNGIPLLVVGRAIAGGCVGICSAMVPVYQAEVAPKEIRGRVISLQQWAITWGILIQYFIVSSSGLWTGLVSDTYSHRSRANSSATAIRC